MEADDRTRAARPWPDPDRPLDLSDVVVPVEPDPFTVGLDGIVDQIVECLARRDAVTPCLVGPQGSGRTTTLAALASRIARDDRVADLAGRMVCRVRAEAVVGGGRAAALRTAQAAHQDGIIVFDDLEVLLGLSAPGTDLDLLGVVRSSISRPGLRTIAIVDSAHAGRLEAHDAELHAELERIAMPDWQPDDLRSVGELWRPTLLRHHDVALSSEVVDAAVDGLGDDGQPGDVVAALDRACVRARLRHADAVRADDLPTGREDTTWPLVDADELDARLRERVVGQDEAVRRIAKRLALTSRGLDGRPHRPNGAFLLVGPTGVGKTELAKALAEALFGADDLLIRLDLSEYAHESATARLFGPPPGYIGSDRPEGWFSSRVLAQPRSVVLLDELEKADPTVWNVFLQVLDDGRLTDGRGRTVPFGATVLLATSNLGARAFVANPLGFGSTAGDVAEQAAADVRQTVERTLPPELVNRFDEILVLEPLGPDEIAAIARLQVDALVARLAEQGWQAEVEPEVVDLLARHGYDPAFGARHLTRNVERLLLEPLVAHDPGPVVARLVDGAVEWTPR